MPILLVLLACMPDPEAWEPAGSDGPAVSDDCPTESASNWYADADGDGFGDATVVQAACTAPALHVLDNTDCDDTTSAVNPAAVEQCDPANVDENCNGMANDQDATVEPSSFSTWYQDVDGDGFGGAGASLRQCEAPRGYVSNSEDCDDAFDAIMPGATEVCDTLDNNCDGRIDEDVQSTFYVDADADGYGDPAARVLACERYDGVVVDDTDCDDAAADVHPGVVEVCDAVDQDCDGATDEGLPVYYEDLDADGYGAGTGDCAILGVAVDGDCDDTNDRVFPTATELCDGVVNDCDESSSWDSSFEDQVVSYVATDDTWSDVSSDFVGATGSYDLPSTGTYYFCSGTYDVEMSASSDEVAIVGLYGAADTVLGYSPATGSPLMVVNGNVTVAGVTLSGGKGILTYGGAALVMASGRTATSATLTLEDCVVTDNQAESGGGLAVYNGGWLALVNTEVYGNDAESGGGIYVTSTSVLEVDGGAIHGNTAAQGGGVYVDGHESGGGDASFVDAEVYDNSSDEWGGGVFVYNGTVSVSGGGVYNNASGYGGGVFLLYAGALLSVSASDFGSGATDNDPSDVSFFIGTPYTAYGAGATFTCTAGDCL